MNQFKRNQPLVIAIILLAVLVTGVFVIVRYVTTNQIGQVQTKQEQKKEVWTCPMHPQVKKDGPGKCPICGMTLVNVDEVEVTQQVVATAIAQTPLLPHAHAPFKLSLEREQMIGVKLGIVEKKPLFKTIKAAGRVAFDPELYTAQNEYLEAIRQLGRVKDSPVADVKHSAERMVYSSRLRLKVLGLGDQAIAVIANRTEANQNLLFNQQGSDTSVYAEIFEMDLPHVQAGQSVEIRGSFLRGRMLPAKIVSVDRVINSQSRTAKARILVPKSTVQFRPESFVDVAILAPLGEQIVVPFDAIFDTGNQSWVFVKKSDGTFDPRIVNVKFQAGDEVAIESGLSGGEQIVTSANFLIDSESRLKAAATTESESGSKMPSCPEGQQWHAEMQHCMPKIGGDGK